MDLPGRPIPDDPHTVEESRRALSQYCKLQADLATVDSIAASLNISAGTKKLIEGLRTIRHDVDGLGEFLSVRIEPNYYNERREPHSTIARRVFAIPEMLEHILLQADIETVLKMCQVSREIKNTIDASPSLQVKLCLKAASNGGIEAEQRSRPFRWDYLGLSVMVGGDVGPGSADVFAKITECGGQLPKIGETWKRMLICQPPVKVMFAYLICSRQGRSGYDVGRVASEIGLTIGDLHDAAKLCLEYADYLCRDATLANTGSGSETQQDIHGIRFKPPTRLLIVGSWHSLEGVSWIRQQRVHNMVLPTWNVGLKNYESLHI